MRLKYRRLTEACIDRPLHVLAIAFSFLLIATAFALGYALPRGSVAYLDLFKITVIACQITTLGFVVVYTRVAKWWNNPVGRTIVAIDLSLFLALFPVTLSIFFELNRVESQIGAAVDLAAFVAISITMLWRIYVWLRLRRQGV